MGNHYLKPTKTSALTMARDYSTIDALLQKANLYCDFCEEVALDIYYTYKTSDTMEGQEFDEWFHTQLDETITDIWSASAEDYINSYGIMTALLKYQEEYGQSPPTAHALLYCICEDKIRSRLDGMIENNDPVPDQYR